MFKLLLVDDEPIFIRGIRKLIDWNAYGCDAIQEAMDAEEALGLIDAGAPDVIMTDLVMPGMGGLAFIKKLSHTHPEIPIIILSGHGEFEYAREAMKNGVCEYLLKPVARDQLKEVVARVVERLAQKRDAEEQERARHRQLQESLPLLREQAIAALLRGHIEQHCEVARITSLLSLEPDVASHVVLMMEMDEPDEAAPHSLPSATPAGEPATVPLHLQDPRILTQTASLCDAFLQQEELGCAAVDGEAIGVLLSLRHTADVDAIVRTVAEKLGRLVQEKTGMTATFGIGGRYPDLNGIHRSRNQANNALRYAFFAGRNRVVDIREVARGMREVAKYPTQTETEVLDIVRFQPGADANALAAELVHAFVAASGWQRESVFNYSFEFCTQLRRTAAAAGAAFVDTRHPGAVGTSTTEMPLTLDTVRERIWHCRKEQQLTQLLAEVLATTLASLDSQRELRKPDVIAQAKAYIDSHYHQDLTLGEVAGHVFMSPTYFSSQYKSRTGENFHAYLKRVRMETAALLLADDSLMLQEIGAMVGFRNPRCFSEAFKRHHGLLPSEYRNTTARKQQRP